YLMNVPRYGEASSSRIRFYPFGGTESYTQNYASLVERRYDLVLPQPSKMQFSIHYALPAGYAISEVPPEVKEQTKFGQYQMSCRLEKGSAACSAEIQFTATRIAPVDYSTFRAFLGRLDQAFTRKLSAVGSGRSAQK